MPAETTPRSGENTPQTTAWDNMTVPRNTNNAEAEKAKKVQSIYGNSEKFRQFIADESMDFDNLSDSEKAQAYEKYNNIEVGNTMRSKEQWKWIPEIKDQIDAAGGIDNVSDLQLGQMRTKFLESFKNNSGEESDDTTGDNPPIIVTEDETDESTDESDSDSEENVDDNAEDNTEEADDQTDGSGEEDTEGDGSADFTGEEYDTDEEEDDSSEDASEAAEKEKKRRTYKKIGAAAAMAALLLGGGLAANKAAKNVKAESQPNVTIKTYDELNENESDDSKTDIEKAVEKALEQMENLDIAGHYNIDDGYAAEDNVSPNPDKFYIDANGETRGQYNMVNFRPTFEAWLNSGEGGERDDSIVTEKLFEIMENQPECASMVRGMLQTIGYEEGNADFKTIEQNTEGSKEGYQETMGSVEDFFKHVTKVEPGAAYGYCTNFYMRSAFDGSQLDSSKIELVKDANWNENKPADGKYNVMVFTAEKDGKTYTIMIKGACAQGLLGAKYEVDVPPVEVTTPPVVTTETTHPTETTTVTTETTPSSTTTTVETTTPDTTTTSSTTTKTSTTTTPTTTTETTSSTTTTTVETTAPPETTTTTEYTTTTTKITDLTTTPVTTTTTIETTPVTTTVVNKDQEDLARAMGDHAQQEKTNEEASKRPDPVQYDFDSNTGYFVNPSETTPVGPKPFEEIINNADKTDASGNDMTEQVVKADEAIPPVFTVEDNREAEQEAKVAADQQKPADADAARSRFGRRP